MSDLKATFDAAAVAVKDLPQRPDDDILLKLYALYKQATSGDVQGERPGFVDFVAAAKFDAWSRLQGTSEDEAMRQYVELVQTLRG